MSDKETLRECPFCGGKPELMVDFAKHFTRVACRECPCLTLWRETTASAIAAWNRRAGSDRLAAAEKVAEVAMRMERAYSPEALMIMMGRGFVVSLRAALSEYDAAKSRAEAGGEKK